MITLIYVLLCLIGIVAVVMVGMSIMEISYFLMLSKASKFVERDNYKFFMRWLKYASPICILCIYFMELLRPKLTNELLLSMIFIVVATTSFVIGILPPLLHEDKRIMPKKHHFF